MLVYNPDQDGAKSESAAAPSVAATLPEPATVASMAAPEKDVPTYYGVRLMLRLRRCEAWVHFKSCTLATPGSAT